MAGAKRETLSEAEAWDRDKEHFLTRGLSNKQAALAAWRRQSGDGVPLPDLLRHMAVHYSESQLRNDLDAVLPLCESDSDRAEVKRFAKAKLSGRPYEIPGLESKQCEGCRKAFSASRSDARYCSPACRKSASRKAARARHT